MKNSVVNGLATATVAVFCTQVFHEFVHLISAWVVGAGVNAFNLFAVDTVLYNNPQFMMHDIIIEASASIMNVVAGVIALILFHRIRSLAPVGRQFLLQLTGYSFLMGFGYFLFDGLFYSPNTPGDWRSVLTILNGSILLRVVLVVTGAGGMLFTLFWLGRNVLVFAEDRHNQKSRMAAAAPILLVPYIVLGGLYVFLSLWHPLGFPTGMVVVFFQFVFGFSGLLWGYMLAVYWLEPDIREPRSVYPVSEISISWLLAAVLLLVFQVAVLLPTVTLL